MKKFDKMFRGGDNNSRGRDFEKRDRGENRFGGGDRERPQMHEATCSDCGKRCEVPFRPTGDRPIYCSDCFTNHRESPTSNRPPRRDYDRDRPRSQERDRQMFDATCAKCGARFELPFRPIGDKPVYCKECFTKSSSYSSSEKPADQYKKQFDMLNDKLDRIIKALVPAVLVEKKEENKKEEAVSKTEEKTGDPKKVEKKAKKEAAKKTVDKKKTKK